MRKVINLNNEWKFTKLEQDPSKSFTDEGWESVSVPHTWNAIDGINQFNFYQGACWYQKTLTLPENEKGNRIFIEFAGANSVTDVYLNGEHLGQHRGGYSAFRFDLTEHFKFGKPNLLAVKVDNSIIDDVYPLRADFTFYGGIYRDVNLVIVNPVHIDLMDYGSQGVYVVQEEVTDDRAELSFKTRVTNSHNEEFKIRVWIDLYDQDGNIVNYGAADVNVDGNATTAINISTMIKNPNLWDGLNNPYIYEAHVAIHSYNDVVDEIVVPFGVRYFKVDPKEGFLLNGKKLDLRGVSRHQDRKDMGWAITKKEHEEDMALIKEVGATSIRLAHYQHDQYFYSLCDREGMVVWAEIPFITAMSATDLTGKNAKSQLIELIRQNFNHPSIIFWGIHNEIQIDSSHEEATRKVVKELNDLAKKEDPTRLTTMANLMMIPDDDEYHFITDAVGINAYYGWYNGKEEDFADKIDTFHKTNPDTCLSISEYGAEGIIEYHSDDPVVKDYTEEFHALYHERVWSIFSKRPFLWGTYVWNMFDFGSNRRDEGGVQGRNNKGLVTFDRKIKKDAFYMYKAHWSNDPFVHITGKRFIERASETIDVKVYTNCTNLTLLVNGEKVDSKSNDEKIVIFKNVRLTEAKNHIEVVASMKEKTYLDQAWFEKVDVQNPSYEAPVDDTHDMVLNWFDKPEYDENEPLEEIEIPDDVYSTRDTLDSLMSNEATKEIVNSVLGEVMKLPMYDMMKGLKVDILASMDNDNQLFSNAVMNRLNRELVKIKKN